MKIKSINIIGKSVLEELLEKEYDKGRVLGEKMSKVQITNLKETIEALERKLKKAERDWNNAVEDSTELKERLGLKIDVLERERHDAESVVAHGLANKDKDIQLESRKNELDELATRLRERESKLSDNEEGRYKEGYADGLADGVRKIHEITKVDRENAMKIAMVSAASHTPTENLKELNSVHQLTSGSSD